MPSKKIDIHQIKKLQSLSRQARQLMIEALIGAGCGHPGGAFSSIDLIIALYFGIMKIDPSNPKRDDRDRFILSKGHSSVALYTALHLRGFFDKKTLLTFRQNESSLGGHPDMHKISGIEVSTGSLGHGISVGAGLALAAKIDKKKHRVFVLMGDGETQEGSVWEAALFCSHYKLDNLTVLIDRNMLQIDGFTEKIMALEPYKEKWQSFGWETRQINGHNFQEIISTLEKVPFKRNKPSFVIAKTIKGKGISFMENNPAWHGKALIGDFAIQARTAVSIS